MTKRRFLENTSKTVALSVFIVCFLMLFSSFVSAEVRSELIMGLVNECRHTCSDENASPDTNANLTIPECQSQCHIASCSVQADVDKKGVLNTPAASAKENISCSEHFYTFEIVDAIFKPPRYTSV